MDLMKYKHSLGKPKEGLHSYRLPGDVALVDTSLTIVSAYAITYIFKIPISYTIIGMFGLGIIAHKLVGIET